MADKPWKRAERRVAELFADVFQCEVRRTPCSGGWGKTGGQRDEFGTGADIVSDKSIPYFVEIKHRQTWTVEQLFTGKGELWKWWDVVAAKARANSKDPLLVLFRPRSPFALVVLERSRFAPQLAMSGIFLATTHHYVVTWARFEEILRRKHNAVKGVQVRDVRPACGDAGQERQEEPQCRKMPVLRPARKQGALRVFFRGARRQS